MLVFLQYSLWIDSGSLTEIHHLRKQKQSIIYQHVLLKERNDSLFAEIMDLKQGLDAVEERARNEMGMIKQGEIFYHLVNKKYSIGAGD